MDARNVPLTRSITYPPGPRPNLLSCPLVWTFRRDPLSYLARLVRDYGDVSCFKIGRRYVYLINHPDFIRAILDVDRGNFVQTQLLQRLVTFPSERLSSGRDDLYFPLRIADYKKEIAELTACISTGWQDGQSVDIHAEMTFLCRVILGEAGVETIANTLTWTWYLLTQNPDSERCMQAELDSVLAGRLPDYRDLENLAYTRKVLAESMRLYPPVWLLCRQAIQDYPLDVYLISGGTTVLISPWIMHHDARYYPNPFRFEPSRWTVEAQKSRPRYTYLPFGDSRIEGCEELPWTILLLITATFARIWRFRLATSRPVVTQPDGILRPRHRINMVLESRESKRYCKFEEATL